MDILSSGQRAVQLLGHTLEGMEYDFLLPLPPSCCVDHEGSGASQLGEHQQGQQSKDGEEEPCLRHVRLPYKPWALTCVNYYRREKSMSTLSSNYFWSLLEHLTFIPMKTVTREAWWPLSPASEFSPLVRSGSDLKAEFGCQQ